MNDPSSKSGALLQIIPRDKRIANVYEVMQSEWAIRHGGAWHTPPGYCSVCFESPSRPPTPPDDSLSVPATDRLQVLHADSSTHAPSAAEGRTLVDGAFFSFGFSLNDDTYSKRSISGLNVK